ncbi:MAG: hypothetical protein DME48_14625, partial [Verrucomicrobia bacterium]
TRIHSNDEVRMTNDELSPNDEIRNREEASVTLPLSFGHRHSFGIRHPCFIIVFVCIRVHSWLRHANHQPQIEEQKRRGK